MYSQSQAHGFQWENHIRQNCFNLSKENNNTDKHDIPCEKNKYDENENISIKNFTIQNGAYSGIFIENIEDSNIENCIVKNNFSPLDGGGIAIENSNNITLKVFYE